MATATAAPPALRNRDPRRPRIHVPLVIGHEEVEDEAAFLDRTNVHASGWITRIWRQGHDLLADIDELADIDAALIEAHRYRSCSAEIYPEPPEGTDGEGMVLRRVAIMGGDQPQVKSLGSIPMPEPGTRGKKISGMIIFASGIHRGKAYTDRDLDQIVANFNRLSSDARPEKYSERGPWVNPGVYLVPRGSTVMPNGLYRVFHECVACQRSEVPEKFCGGAGGKPGVCPKGREQAHVTVRAHAGAAAHAAGKTGAALKKAQAAHANARHGTKAGVAANEKLSAAQAAHEEASGKAQRLHKKATALEHQHAVQTRLKSAKKGLAAGKKPAPVQPKPGDHAKHVSDAVAAHGGEHNLAPLHKVRAHLVSKGITDRVQQDAAIHKARQSGAVTGSALEGRHGVSPEQLAAAIDEGGGRKIGHLSTRQGAAKPAAAKAATAAPTKEIEHIKGLREKSHGPAGITDTEIDTAMHGLRDKTPEQLQHIAEALDLNRDDRKSGKKILAGVRSYLSEVGHARESIKVHERGEPYERFRDLTRPRRFSHAPSQRHKARAAQAGPTKFSEVAMDRDEMIKKLSADHGVEAALLEKLDDVTLAAWLRSVDSPAEEEEESEEEEHEPAEFDDEEKPEGFEESEEEEHEEEPDGLPRPRPMKMGGKSGKPAKYSERDVRKLVASAVAREIGKASKKLDRIQKFSEVQLASARKSASAAKRARIDDEFKALISSGQVLPAEVDAGLKTLAYLQSDTRVHKFSEVKDGKKVDRQETQLDTFLRTLKGRPALIRFGERFASPAEAKSAAGEEEQIVRAHVEKFREAYKASGIATEKVVEDYKALPPPRRAEMLAGYKKSLAS